MFHAAALFAGLAGLFALLSPVWRGPETIAVALAAAGFVVLWISRFGGADAESMPAWRLARLLPLLGRRVAAGLLGAAAVGRMALAADVTLQPALVRLKARPRSDASRAALAHLVTATPGAVMVEADAEGLLIHVLQEEAVDAAALSALERNVAQAMEGRAS